MPRSPWAKATWFIGGLGGALIDMRPLEEGEANVRRVIALFQAMDALLAGARR
jgi:hypothetical protein